MLLHGSVAGEDHPLGWAGPRRWPGLARALMPLQSRKRARVWQGCSLLNYLTS